MARFTALNPNANESQTAAFMATMTGISKTDIIFKGILLFQKIRSIRKAAKIFPGNNPTKPTLQN